MISMRGRHWIKHSPVVVYILVQHVLHLIAGITSIQSTVNRNRKKTYPIFHEVDWDWFDQNLQGVELYADLMDTIHMD